MEKLKRLLKSTMIVLAALLVTAAALPLSLGLLIYFYPQDAWRIAQPYLVPSDMKVEWRDARLNLDIKSWLSWNFGVSLVDLTLEKKSHNISAKVDYVELRGTATVFSPATKVQIQNLVLKSDSMLSFIRIPDTQVKAASLSVGVNIEELVSKVKLAKSILKRIEIGEIDTQLSDIRYSSAGSKPILASVRLSKSNQQLSPISFVVKVREFSEMVSTLDLSGAFELSHFGTQAPFLTADIHLNGPLLTG